MGNWSAVLDCGERLPEGASGQWQVSYRKPGENAFITLASAAEPWGTPREPLIAPFDPGADLVIRACPRRSRDQPEAEALPLELSVGVPEYLTAGLAVGIVTPTRGGLQVDLLASESEEDHQTIQDALEKLLDVPGQRPAPFWFTILWRDGRVEGIALDL